MKTQTRIVLLLVMVSAAFLGGIALLGKLEQGHTALLLGDRVRERKELFDKVVALKRVSLENHVNFEYTLWDEMAEFVKTRDPVWARLNIDVALETYDISGAWVYDVGFEPVYSATDSGAHVPLMIPLSPAEFGSLFRGRDLCHFFIRFPQGLAEIIGAGIHGTDDDKRRTPPVGYYFVGKLWSNDYLAELSRLTEGQVRLVPTTATGRMASDREARAGRIRFLTELTGYDRKPVARLEYSSDSPLIGAYVRSSQRSFALLLGFAVGLLLLVFLLLFHWVSLPLKFVSRSLAERNPDAVVRLLGNRTEFGHIARLVREFFNQQTELIHHREHLEELVKERTRALEQAQAELVGRERLAALGQIAGSIAHELRNPLAVIRNATYLLGLTASDRPDSETAKHVEMINDEVARSNQIITSLLDFARGRPCEPGPCAVADIVAEAIGRAQLGRLVRLEQNIPQDLPPVMSDPGQMAQVFLNLLTNAKQATPDGGTIRVSAARVNDTVRVTVSDTGTGITPEHVKRLFEPLFSTKTVGVGLGLAICKSFVEANKGTISVETAVGKGTTFTVTLPAAA